MCIILPFSFTTVIILVYTYTSRGRAGIPKLLGAENHHTLVSPTPMRLIASGYHVHISVRAPGARIGPTSEADPGISKREGAVPVR